MGRRITIPEESKTAFFEMISQDMSCLRATQAVGVSETTGRRWLKEAGITLSRGGRGGNAQTSADKLEVAATLLEQGLSPREIGEYVDLSRANISLWRIQGPDKLRQRAAALRAQASAQAQPDSSSVTGSQPDTDAGLGVDTTAGAKPPLETETDGGEGSANQQASTDSHGKTESSAGAGGSSGIPSDAATSSSDVEPSPGAAAESSPGVSVLPRVRFHTPVIGSFHGPRSLHQVLIEDYTEIFRQLSSMGLTVNVCGALLHIAPRSLLSCVSMPDTTPLFADHAAVVGRGTRLSIEEKLTIQRLHHEGKSAAEIGRCIGRCRQTVSREILRGQDEQGRYWAKLSHERSQDNLARPKLRKIDANPRLRAVVIAGLNKRLSPEQISCCLAIDYAYDSAMQISHETIYQALYVQGKGALRDELKVEKYLRTGRTGRKPRSKLPVRGKPWVAGSMISQRPEEVDDRRVPGHWEGDLIIGSGNQASALVTLVERTSRLTLIKRLGVNHEAATVTDALVEMMGDLPQALRRSLTWDQGVEMADHARFSVATDCPVYFCDPHSPWQRGSNENTNGLVRDFLPKGTNFANVSDEEVQQVQDLLNLRPRKMHGFQSAAQVYEQIAVGASTD